MVDFMQFDESKRAALTAEQEDALSEYGQFYSCVADFKFLAKLRTGEAKRRERDEWFETNKSRSVCLIAQGILASVYGEDPP